MPKRTARLICSASVWATESAIACASWRASRSVLVRSCCSDHSAPVPPISSVRHSASRPSGQRRRALVGLLGCAVAGVGGGGGGGGDIGLLGIVKLLELKQALLGVLLRCAPSGAGAVGGLL